MPDWRERHVPDLGIALVELLAYTGDYLSYYQDAVATEAYLDTARRRISVRRHARLVDYPMHEGCNARAWVFIETEADRLTLALKDVAFRHRLRPGIAGLPAGKPLRPDDLRNVSRRALRGLRAACRKVHPISTSSCAGRTTRSASTPGATPSAACRAARSGRRCATSGGAKNRSRRRNPGTRPMTTTASHRRRSPRRGAGSISRATAPFRRGARARRPASPADADPRPPSRRCA